MSYFKFGMTLLSGPWTLDPGPAPEDGHPASDGYQAARSPQLRGRLLEPRNRGTQLLVPLRAGKALDGLCPAHSRHADRRACARVPQGQSWSKAPSEENECEPIRVCKQGLGWVVTWIRLSSAR
jgi:hypothetical protein